MFREMRRRNQQTSAEECERILLTEKRGVLSVNGDDGYPYGIPMNFFYDAEEKTVYLHSAVSGHKIDSIKRSAKVCFTVFNEGCKKDDWSYYVTSVIVFGRAETVDTSEKERIYDKLRKLGMKYYPSGDEVEKTMEKHAADVRMIALHIERMTGKLVHEK